MGIASFLFLVLPHCLCDAAARPGNHRSGVRSECDGSPACCRAGDTEAQQRGQSGIEAWPRGLACREGCIAGEDEVLLALGFVQIIRRGTQLSSYTFGCALYYSRINDHDEIRITFLKWKVPKFPLRWEALGEMSDMELWILVASGQLILRLASTTMIPARSTCDVQLADSLSHGSHLTQRKRPFSKMQDCKCDDRGWHGSIFLRDKIHDDPQCRYHYAQESTSGFVTT
ncbi:hypothetical protein EJB05_29317, partial [Eragrostis curvula]